MEPVITHEGYEVLQNSQKSRDLLSDYYRSLGFRVVNPSPFQNDQDIDVIDEEKKDSKNNQEPQHS
jgi:hypothetical protein